MQVCASGLSLVAPIHQMAGPKTDLNLNMPREGKWTKQSEKEEYLCQMMQVCAIGASGRSAHSPQMAAPNNGFFSTCQNRLFGSMKNFLGQWRKM